MHYRYHLIQNFPPNYPLWRKIGANIMFFVGGRIIHYRENLLSDADLKRAKKILKPGDIVLVGGFRRVSCLVIRGSVTHAMMYIGHRTFIHSVIDGIETDGLHDVFCEYDTMVILRSAEAGKKQIRRAIKYALSKLGKPFDFEFSNDPNKFYCSELVIRSFDYAKIVSGLSLRGVKPVHPLKFINPHFKVMFLSHTLKLKKGKLVFKGDRSAD